MTHSTIISLLLFLNNFCFGQTTKEQKFKATVQQIVTAFSKQDSATVSKYIYKNFGFYQLDRIGVFDHYNHFKTLSFSDTGYPQVLFSQSKNIKLLPLKYTKLPMWDCDKEAWSKKGLFVDTTKTNHLLSKICKDRNKYIPDTISNKTIQFFYDLENKSRRVVLYDNNGVELVFYLSYLNDKWFLTIIDNVSVDTKFDTMPSEFIGFAEADLQTDFDHRFINALSNAKRALDCQADRLLKLVGYYRESQDKFLGFPKKISLLQKLDIIAPRILNKINRTRNLMEHQYIKPNSEQVEDFIDIVSLFIASTDQYALKSNT